MPHVDLKTGELYGELLWKDEHVAVFLSPWGESWLTARELTEPTPWPGAGDYHAAGGFTAWLPRFQELSEGQAVTLSLPAQERADALTAYAARNGGVIHVDNTPPAGLGASLGRAWRRLRPSG